MRDKSELLDWLTGGVGEILKSRLDRDYKLRAICRMLRNCVPNYDWVGFYTVDKKRPNELVLGPFEGEPTEHVRIPFGRGICGQAASLSRTFVVQDVSKEKNYLSCNANVRSEIVAPIFKGTEIVGELDVDSHALSPFTVEDEVFLRKIGEMVSGIL
jgi:L-methionine (R)-S-oxide reductase